MKRSHDEVADQDKCEGWLSTRNRRKICPPASSSRVSMTRKHPSFSFKLTQNPTPSQLNIPQHQSSILNFVKKAQEEKNPGTVKRLFNGKDIQPNLQNMQTDIGRCPPETPAGAPTNNSEYKCQHLLKPKDETALRLEGVTEKTKEKDLDNSERNSSISRENVFSKDPIRVETNKMSSFKASENDCSSRFYEQNASVSNEFESRENQLPCDTRKKSATTPTKPINQDLSGSPRVSSTNTGSKCVKDPLVHTDSITDSYADDPETPSAVHPEISSHNSESPPYKKRQVSCCSTEKMLLKRKQYLKRSTVNACPPSESSDSSNPVDVKGTEERLPSSSRDKKDLLDKKKAARESLADFSKSDHDPSLPDHSENSEKTPQKKVSSNFQTDQIPGSAHSSHSLDSPQCQRREIREDDANSNPPNAEEIPSTDSVNRNAFIAHDFESVTRSFVNSSYLSDDGSYEDSVCLQDDVDESLNLEADNIEFTLRTQRDLDQEIDDDDDDDFMQETEDFTFNSGFMSPPGSSRCGL